MPNYLSVSEYAKLNGKDPGNIRRLLASGRMEGMKIGNQWVILESTPYPKDKRENTGQYHNWRNRVALYKQKELMVTISSMVDNLRKIYGSMMQEVILYGSYARGMQTEESDIDIAVILQGKPSKAKTEAMVECVSTHELECGKVLSVIDIDSEMYNQWKDDLPFYRNIHKEGIVLWKAAA